MMSLMTSDAIIRPAAEGTNEMLAGDLFFEFSPHGVGVFDEISIGVRAGSRE